MVVPQFFNRKRWLFLSVGIGILLGISAGIVKKRQADLELPQVSTDGRNGDVSKLSLLPSGVVSPTPPPQNEHGLTKEVLAGLLSDADVFQDFPTDFELNLEGKPTPVVVQYTFDSFLQGRMEKLFSDYRPDYGAFVAIDAKTGRVLSMVSYAHNRQLKDHLALRATFPSASVFKVVTAAAAIAEKNFSGDTEISFSGRNHTLYKSAILKSTPTRWTKTMTLKKAFGLSVNTVFGKMGAYTVGAEKLREYATRFGFNRKISADFPLQEGKATIQDDAWELAESASGYTKDNRMSPLQGALIAASVVNDGVMMEPYLIENIFSQDGQKLYSSYLQAASQTVSSDTARELRRLMRETISSGTSRKHFRGFFKSRFAEIEVGGKTGSLTGDDPKGKYDWFVGYGEYHGQRVAIAALTVNERVWRVKSSYVARRAIETYFQDKLTTIHSKL